MYIDIEWLGILGLILCLSAFIGVIFVASSWKGGKAYRVFLPTSIGLDVVVSILLVVLMAQKENPPIGVAIPLLTIAAINMLLAGIWRPSGKGRDS